MIWVLSRFFSMNIHECIRNEIQYTQNTISREMISTTHFRKTNTFFISQKKICDANFENNYEGIS